jgi:hypothetical protein
MLARDVTLPRITTGKDLLADVTGETGFRDDVPGLNVLGQVGGDPGHVGADSALVHQLTLLIQH